MIHTNLRIPFCEQKSDSAACGPCCLKMVLDHYRKRRNRKKYTKMSLVRLAKTTAEEGTTFVNMKRVLRQAGLKTEKLLTEVDLMRALSAGNPVIALVKDPGPYINGEPVDEYHYIVLTGIQVINGLFGGVFMVYDDPYYGPGQAIMIDSLWRMMKPDLWMIEIKSP